MTEIEKAKAYLSDVRKHKALHCGWIKKAVARHDADLKRKGWEFYFDEDEAARVLGMFSFFRFSKGDVSGKPFEIMGWFAALIYLAYGWRRISGGRRFRKVYCKVPRGNAKTANLVNVATIGFLFDGQGDSEVYWLAMNKSQAKIGWDRQREMLRAMITDFPELGDAVYLPAGNTSPRMTLKTGLSWVEYVGQDSPGRDGLNPFYVICDELHEWKNDDLMNKFESGMVKVADPVTWIITTAGYYPDGPDSRFTTACKNMLDGVAEDDALLAFIYEPDDGDDWRDEKVWSKVNPGMGISLTLEGLRTEYNKIQSQGMTKEVDFKVKNLNIPAIGSAGWIRDEDWMACKGDIDWEDLKGRDCWGGLDLANTGDFNAFVLFFPPIEDGQKAVVVPYFWTPEDNIDSQKRTRPFLWQWVNDGHITATPGNVTDYGRIRRDIKKICAELRLQAIAYDSKLSSYLTPDLIEDGFRMEIYQQGWSNMAPPAQFFELAIMAKPGKAAGDGDPDAEVFNVPLMKILHDGNPVARWMMRNVVMQHSRTSLNALPSKAASADKIDFVSATLNAIGQWLTDRGTPKIGSYLFESEVAILNI
jgi:phage terminase large subunit-like protein